MASSSWVQVMMVARSAWPVMARKRLEAGLAIKAVRCEARGSTRGMRRVLPVLLLGLAEVIEHLVHLFQGEGGALVGAAGFPGDEVDGVPGAEAFIDGTLEDG